VINGSQDTHTRRYGTRDALGCFPCGGDADDSRQFILVADDDEPFARGIETTVMVQVEIARQDPVSASSPHRDGKTGGRNCGVRQMNANDSSTEGPGTPLVERECVRGAPWPCLLRRDF